MHEVVKQLLLDRTGVFHADHYLRQQVLEDTGRSEIVGRTYLAQVGHHRIAGLRAVDGETSHQRLAEGEQVVTYPGHWQIGEDILGVGQPVELGAAAGRRDEGIVRLADALRLAGRARGIEHDADVVSGALLDFVAEKIGVILIVDPAHRHQLFNVVNEGLGVVAHAPRIVIDDVFERRQLILDFEQFVDLLLIFGQGEADACILQHEEHFGADRILIQGHRHATEALHGGHHHVQTGAVVADDGEVVTTLEAHLGQTTGDCADMLGNIGPGPRLPDTEIFLAHRHFLATHLGMIEQQTRKGIQRPGSRIRHFVSSVIPETPLPGQPIVFYADLIVFTASRRSTGKA